MSIFEHPGYRFEQLIAELLRELGQVKVKTDFAYARAPGQMYEIDIIFGEQPSLGVIEVKHYRYFSQPRIELFIRALEQARRIKNATDARIGILAISCPLTPLLADAAKQYEDIEVWDAEVIFRMASERPALLIQFEQLFEIGAETASRKIVGKKNFSDHLNVVQKEGEKLAGALRSISPGQLTAREFETACIASLRYLFELDLHGWYEQHETQDKLHRRDLVCRILPKSEVWMLMLNDLRSRYVVFEFKNYTDPITQNEIVTTERYLFPSALRKVAIIISPMGCAESAEKVIQGSMRDQGKLIISLKVSEIVMLLIEKDSGTDPNTYLFERIDNFLLRLGR